MFEYIAAFINICFSIQFSWLGSKVWSESLNASLVNICKVSTGNNWLKLATFKLAEKSTHGHLHVANF